MGEWGLAAEWKLQVAVDGLLFWQGDNVNVWELVQVVIVQHYEWPEFPSFFCFHVANFIVCEFYLNLSFLIK
jgi:hypothetical protein